MADRPESGVLDTRAYVDLDGEAAARYGSLVALTLDTKRGVKPRRLDLMIAAIASFRESPLYTRDVDDFAGLDDMVTVMAV